MNTVLFGFQLGIGLILAYVIFNLIARGITILTQKYLIYKLKKSLKTSKPSDLNFG